MTWKPTFDKGVACFKLGDLEQALVHMNQAAKLQSDIFIIYDSRAAVHEKLGNTKAALLDSKRVIDLAPNRWQGYARSARLFDLVGRYGSAIEMVDHALARLRPEDAQRRTQLVELREKAVAAQAAHVARTSYLLGKLPVETLVEVFSILIGEDHTWAVKLSHVCGHWRRILINTPSAWRTLVLSEKHPLQKTKLWKQRAKNRIVRISVDMSKLDHPPVFAQLRDLSWDCLSSLCISSEAFNELNQMLSDISLPHTLSNLDELTLLGCGPTRPCLLSGPSWKLGTLRLTGFHSMGEEWWRPIQRLKELHFQGHLIRLPAFLFTTNASLEKLVLNCLAVLYEPNPDAAVPTSMDNLKIIKCRNSNVVHVLSTISTPSVTHFSIFSSMHADRILLHIASRPSLVELQIGNCSLDSSTLPTLLSSTPNLETLQINAIHAVVNEVFQFLTPKTVDSEHTLPCRALKHVDVSKCSDLTTSSVYAFVKTRAQYASESVASSERCVVVVSLKVDQCPNIEPDMLPWFRSKVAQFSCVYATKKDLMKDQRRRP